jgi:hypothetical protein
MFTPTEKNMLIGAFVTAGVDAGLEAYWNYMYGKGTPVANIFPYQRIHEALPPYDDWIACAGTPLLLYLLGKGLKKPRLVEMAKGGAIYGVSELLGETMETVAVIATPASTARYVLRS